MLDTSTKKAIKIRTERINQEFNELKELIKETEKDNKDVEITILLNRDDKDVVNVRISEKI